MSIKCELCFHRCELAEEQTGFCRARICRDGAVVPLNYGKLTSLALDPIEKKAPAPFPAQEPDSICGQLRLQPPLFLLSKP